MNISKKPKILFVYNEMVIGGSTTSLLSILHNLNYDKYSVDLLLYYNNGPLLSKVPKQVTILKRASLYSPNMRVRKYIRSILKGGIHLLFKLVCNIILKKKVNDYSIGNYTRMLNSRKIVKQYDVAIGFLEGWPNYFVSKRINAEKKVCWIHTDYRIYKSEKSVLNYDKKIFKAVNKIVLVSEQNRENFKSILPEISSKTISIENILHQETIRQRSNEFKVNINIDSSKINIISIGRIDFSSKGLDRGVYAFDQLKDESLLSDLHWYIVGDGVDLPALRDLVSSLYLTEHITLLGKMDNPLPYLTVMDLLFLPSNYEGKPMVVTEAHMLGIPVLVTNYSAAYEQIDENRDGFIVNNSLKHIVSGLKNVISKKNELSDIKKLILKKNYSNNDEIRKVINLIRN